MATTTNISEIRKTTAYRAAAIARDLRNSSEAASRRSACAAELITTAGILVAGREDQVLSLSVLSEDSGLPKPDFSEAVAEFLASGHLRRADIPGAYGYEIDGVEINAVTVHV